jgi:hypothetical protein
MPQGVLPLDSETVSRQSSVSEVRPEMVRVYRVETDYDLPLLLRGFD